MHGIVLYSDGGARPTNPGFAGSGIHGYIYDTSVAVKGIGLGSSVATTQGYHHKTEARDLNPNKTKSKKENKDETITPDVEMTETEVFMACCSDFVTVMPIQYIDMAIPIEFTATNNFAELNGVLRALEYIVHCKELQPDLKYAVINTDSELTVKGCNEWLENWKRNGFRKSDGQYVANHQWWDAVSQVIEKVKSLEIMLNIQWVRGHNGEFGNEKSDQMATMAVYRAFRRTFDPVLTLSRPDGYWKLENEMHPFIQHKCIYFNSGPEYHKPGTYNMGNHGKDDDLLGNRQSDGSYSYIRLNTPEDILEKVVSFASDVCNQSDNLWVGYVGRLSLPTTRDAVMFNGENSFDPMSEPHVGYRGIGSGKDPLVRMLRPPHLASRAVTEVTNLSSILQAFECGSASVVSNDVTSLIYDVTEVVDKKDGVIKKYTIKSDLPVGMPSIKLPAKYVPAGTSEVQEREIVLSTGIDILTRNAFKKLENLNPCVHVVTWSDSSDSFRYATVVKTDDAIGIWGGVYSNLFIIPKKEEKNTKKVK